jgi:hypothetical protein
LLPYLTAAYGAQVHEAMSHPDEEYRLLFEKWGAAKVRKMAQSGHYDAEMRRPLLAWIAEKNAKRSRMRQLVLITSLVLFFVALFIMFLEAGKIGPAQHS